VTICDLKKGIQIVMAVRKLTVLSMIVLFAFAVAACGSGKSIPEATSVTTLGESLKAAGMRVEGPNPNEVL
jgi:hypothetical protein